MATETEQLPYLWTVKSGRKVLMDNERMTEAEHHAWILSHPEYFEIITKIDIRLCDDIHYPFMDEILQMAADNLI